MKVFKSAVLLSALIAAGTLFGCSHGNCNNVPQRANAAQPAASPSFDTEVPNTGGIVGSQRAKPVQADAMTKSTLSASGTISIFKASGELQCDQAPAVPLETMSKQLTRSKIKVLSSSVKDDGMMHVQMCGSPTGRINVFEIQQSDLKKALKAGFKEWRQP